MKVRHEDPDDESQTFMKTQTMKVMHEDPDDESQT